MDETRPAHGSKRLDKCSLAHFTHLNSKPRPIGGVDYKLGAKPHEPVAIKIWRLGSRAFGARPAP